MKRKRKTEPDPNVMGVPARLGRPRRNPLAPPTLSAKQERELADAEAGNLEWVSPAVAAHKLGITVDALAKRRQHKHADTPPWKQATPDGKVFYRWDHFHRIRPAQQSEVEALRARVASLEDLVGKLLRHSGVSLDALNTMALWSLDARDRLLGHAAIEQGASVVGYTWLEALQEPWVSEAQRAPYAATALALVDEARLKAVSAEENTQK